MSEDRQISYLTEDNFKSWIDIKQEQNLNDFRFITVQLIAYSLISNVVTQEKNKQGTY